MSILIRKGRVINPSTGFDHVADVLIRDSIIMEISDCIHDDADTVINAEGKLVLPGLIDIHVHFRQPGREDIETIQKGASVAAAGGFTTVCVMPNTTPPPDCAEQIEFIINEGAQSPIEVLPVASITINRKGETLTDMKRLAAHGACAFSDDGSPVSSAEIMRDALKKSQELHMTILAHEEDFSLVNGGAIHLGSVSTDLGIRGIPREAEESMIQRDIDLVRQNGGYLHIQHLSSGGSAELVRQAKKEGLNISCETAPHYFSLTDEAVRTHGSNAKMNPPLREDKDRHAIIDALRDGTIDIIATDHAPHLEKDKLNEIEKAPFGIIGLETSVPLVITKLIREEGFSYIDAFRKMTSNPAALLCLDRGSLEKGKRADVTIIDPDTKTIVSDDTIVSDCKNTPFKGAELFGKVLHTISEGVIVYQD